MYDNKDVKYSRLVIENIDVLIDWLINNNLFFSRVLESLIHWNMIDIK